MYYEYITNLNQNLEKHKIRLRLILSIYHICSLYNHEFHDAFYIFDHFRTPCAEDVRKPLYRKFLQVSKIVPCRNTKITFCLQFSQIKFITFAKACVEKQEVLYLYGISNGIRLAAEMSLGTCKTINPKTFKIDLATSNPIVA